MSHTLVTIAIPTLERLHYLREAVASARAQKHARVEVLVGDDGRDESLRAWCLAQAAEDERVRYMRHEGRLGLAGNWNALADEARGHYLVIIGDDDRLLPDFVSTLLKAATPDTSVIFSNHYLIDEGGRRLEAESQACTRAYARDALPAGPLGDAAASVWRNSVPVCASLIRTADVRRLRFKEDLNTPEIELFARMAEEGARFSFVPEYLAEYRTHAASATAAGLMSERLAERLLDLRVRSEAEGHKREFMSSLLVNAVSRCLEQGDRARARGFLRSEYYPALGRGRRGLKVAISACVQELCVALPTSIGCAAYRALRRAKNTFSL